MFPRLRTVALTVLLSFVFSGLANAQSWTTMAKGKAPTFQLGVALQLTDGRILLQEYGSSNWYTLTPNKFGDYHEGTFTQVKSFPAAMNYAPLYLPQLQRGRSHWRHNSQHGI